MVMAVFAYIYHQSFVVPQRLSVEILLDQVLVFTGLVHSFVFGVILLVNKEL